MLVVADFFRYWLHRGMHQFSALWRLHAVHHSPDVLYALNVGRFHPLEKSIQFFADALPFVVIGVSQEVISVYFIFYAINGFYQHSNAYVRLGFFNYIIAGPELHRWHHAKDVATSNHNFGNNLIIWDWMFGTRHLPRGGHVGELGIGNPTYPRDFIKQTLAPFTLNPNDGG
jgi:sterol desaturase/sphingolipid hydroxylase (fatty acid hydroxylase superfamily)